MRTLILALVVINLLLCVMSMSSTKAEAYEKPPTPMPNWANCQSNGYSDGCVFGAYVGGTLYDYPSRCC